jgi:hypothetical protein
MPSSAAIALATSLEAPCAWPCRLAIVPLVLPVSDASCFSDGTPAAAGPCAELSDVPRDVANGVR